MPNPYGQPVIAIDGSAASGKSSLSKKLATQYGAVRLEYGLFFRLIALHMLEQGFVPAPDRTATPTEIAEAARYARTLTWDGIAALKNDDRLRSAEVTRAAPLFSGHRVILDNTDSTVRRLINASREKPVIVEGRTIGKYVYPEADIKLFIDAHPQARGIRRAEVMRSKGLAVTNAEVIDGLIQRDHLDQTRSYQPATFDPTLHTLIDTTVIPPEATFSMACSAIEAGLPALKIRRQKSMQMQQYG